MSTSLTWQTSAVTSALWSVACLWRRGTLTDPRIEAALRDPASLLADELAACGVPAEDLWSHLLPLSAAPSGHRHSAEVALAKTLGRGRGEQFVDRLAGRIREVERGLKAGLPGLAEELQLRIQPLRDAWEARGPGILHSFGRLADPELLPQTATVVLVLPAVGGGRGKHFPAPT